MRTNFIFQGRRDREGFRSGCRAFTLVEVLLALALLAVLMISLNQFIFSMGELWGKNRQQRLFDQHVRAATRHVEDILERAARSPKSGRGLRMMTSTVPLSGTGSGGPLLTFELPSGDRMLPWPETPLPDVQCTLATESGRGLILHWKSRWETNFDTVQPRTVVLSPLVTTLTYDYYQADTQSWQSQATPMSDKNGQPALPSRLRLHFQYERYSADTTVRVPAPSAALPVF